MRVGLDLVYLAPGQTGGRESYARELIPALLAADPQLELVAFVNRDAGPRLAGELAGGMGATVVPVSPRSRGGWAVGELALVSLAARRARVQLVHAMANFGPPWGGFRRVVTVHDLQYLATPELLSRAARTATHALVTLGARRADRIIAVSAAGRDEIVAGLGIARGRIDVVPHGVRPVPPRDPAAAAAVRERHGLGQRPVILTVATNVAHKNLPALIDALALIEPARRPVAIFAGHATDDGSLADLARAAGVAQDVRLLGACSTEQLESLYALAACLVLPTLHEGFGMPALEAMARSLPVVCSDIAALREVAGAAALYFDPRSPEQVAARIVELLGDEMLARRLRELGLARAKQFSWSQAAAATLASYRRALAGR
jgi:glycosyltransferase involved in cell wall biosynthesis